ncbi:CLUMA_CG006418, isoform A [Clunio marinus]|uniref:CLUMA_CG006418, isoform A n=1 Tax=Clunio marinus TaxID=568069 RepID=A0A1J1HXM2_9DIPT|nr:CLUMA_CG006418, isoform A [Clunio marinus]
MSDPEEQKYRIECVKAGDMHPILNFIEKNYFRSDPLLISLKCFHQRMDKNLEFYIKQSLLQGLSLVAKENSRENKILGVAVNQKSCKWTANSIDELGEICENINTSKLFHIWALLARESESEIHDYQSTNTIFNLGLISVHRELKHRRLQAELAFHSLCLARDLNYELARFDTTNEFTMKIAEEANMTKIWEVPYKNILCGDGKTPIILPNKPHTHAAVYCINLDELNLKNLSDSTN